jgi:hypothetical protein
MKVPPRPAWPGGTMKGRKHPLEEIVRKLREGGDILATD